MPVAYYSRSFRLPFFSLAFPRRWSARPLDLVSLSPVRAPAASFMRPLALSLAPSSLSFPPSPNKPTCSSSTRELTLLSLYPISSETKRPRSKPPGAGNAGPTVVKVVRSNGWSYITLRKGGKDGVEGIHHNPCGVDGGGHRGGGPDRDPAATRSFYLSGPGRHPLRATARGSRRGAIPGHLRPRGRHRRARLQQLHGRPRPRPGAHRRVPDLLPHSRRCSRPRRQHRRDGPPRPGAAHRLHLGMRRPRRHLRARGYLAGCGLPIHPRTGHSDGHPAVHRLRPHKSGAGTPRGRRRCPGHLPATHLSERTTRVGSCEPTRIAGQPERIAGKANAR